MIIKFDDDLWVVWSSVKEAPAVIFPSKDDLTTWYLREYGQSSEEELRSRLARVYVHGTSSLPPMPPMDAIKNNRAGPDDKCLSYDDLVASLRVSIHPMEAPDDKCLSYDDLVSSLRGNPYSREAPDEGSPHYSVLVMKTELGGPRRLKVRSIDPDTIGAEDLEGAICALQLLLTRLQIEKGDAIERGVA